VAGSDPSRGLWRLVALGAAAVSVAAIALFMLASSRHQDAHQRMAQGPQNQLRRLYTAVRIYHTDHGALPPSGGPAPPLGACCGGPEQRCVPVAALWQSEPWASLGFAIDFPQRDSFEVLVEGARVTVRATGDLDCDGARHTFEITGELGPDGALPGHPPMFAQDEAE
jgi:hypothetical protein